MGNPVGRPRRASRELLQEAAFELFQLRGYHRTSAELIARTAGFSRATFFNFFSSKAELFWVETDELISDLEAHLEQKSDEPEPIELSEALAQFADRLDGSAIPWALQNSALIEATDDLIASGATRALRISRAFAQYLTVRGMKLGGMDSDPLALRASASAAAAVLLTALFDWLRAGVGRGSFGPHLRRASVGIGLEFTHG